jgi:hypothetical protein
MSNTDLLTQSEAARLIGVYPGAVANAISRGFLPYEQYGSIKLIRRHEAERYKRNRPQAGRPPKKRAA